VFFRAGKYVAAAGERVLVEWDTDYADAVTVNGMAVTAEGSRLRVIPDGGRTFTLDATGPGGSATASLTITTGVAPPDPPPLPPPLPLPSMVITPASGGTVSQDDSIVLSWTSADATEVWLGNQSVALAGWQALTIVNIASYLDAADNVPFTAIGPGGRSDYLIPITVIQPLPPPPPVTLDQKADLILSKLDQLLAR
jgi:hypothetical protein